MSNPLFEIICTPDRSRIAASGSLTPHHRINTPAPPTTVLFVTGYAHNAALGNGDAAGSGMTMTNKPFRLQQSPAQMRHVLERP